MTVKAKVQKKRIDEKRIDDFISKGGSHPESHIETDDEHRLTLRIPRWLIAKIDEKRTERVGKLSRNHWILKQIERAVED
jgi:hypothetical protein